MWSTAAASSCRRQVHGSIMSGRRTLATQVAAEVSGAQAEPVVRSKRLPRAEITTSVILNRSPIVTRTPTLFERAYYAYQARLRRALHNPFPTEFYFKQGSLLETQFNMEEQKREKRAFGPKFHPKDGYVDEEALAAQKAALDQLAQQEEKEVLMPRTHSSDAARDYKSLDRKGKRNLYLLLQAKDGQWRFPQGNVEKGELLHQAAQRDLYAECGENMDTWIVSRNPIGVFKESPPDLSAPTPEAEKITFFFKGHIMQGQVQPTSNISDFAWLTKQEIEEKVDKVYWDSVKDILSDY